MDEADQAHIDEMLSLAFTGAIALFGAVEGASAHANVAALHVSEFHPAAFLESVGKSDLAVEIEGKGSVSQAFHLSRRYAAYDVGSAFAARPDAFGAKRLFKDNRLQRPVRIWEAKNPAFYDKVRSVGGSLAGVSKLEFEFVAPIANFLKRSGSDKDIGSLLPLVGLPLVGKRPAEIENLPDEDSSLQQSYKDKPRIPWLQEWVIALFLVSVAVMGFGADADPDKPYGKVVGRSLLALGGSGVLGWVWMVYSGWLH